MQTEILSSLLARISTLGKGGGDILHIIYIFLGSALPLYTTMFVHEDYTIVNTTSTEARLTPGS